MSSHADVIQSWRFHRDASLKVLFYFCLSRAFCLLPSAEWHRGKPAQSTAKLQMVLSHNILLNTRLKASFSLLISSERKISHFCGNACECIVGKDTLNTNPGCRVQGKSNRKLKDECQRGIYDARINQVDFTETRCLSIKKASCRPAGAIWTRYQYTDLHQISILISSKFPAIWLPPLLASSAKATGKGEHKKTTASLIHCSALAVQRHCRWSNTSRLPEDKWQISGWVGRITSVTRSCLDTLASEEQQGTEDRCVPGRKKGYVHIHHPIAQEERGCIWVSAETVQWNWEKISRLALAAALVPCIAGQPLKKRWQNFYPRLGKPKRSTEEY